MATTSEEGPRTVPRLQGAYSGCYRALHQHSKGWASVYLVVPGAKPCGPARTWQLLADKMSGDDLLKWWADNDMKRLTEMYGLPFHSFEACAPSHDKKCTRQLLSAYNMDAANKIGEGNYGQVFIGDCKLTHKKVALKTIKLQEDPECPGLPKTALREIYILSSLKQENTVKLREVVRTGTRGFKDDVFMAFDYAEYDLTGFMAAHKHKLPEAQIKCIMKQLLKGLAHVHGNGVLHRDLKPANILVCKDGMVKLADFGLARTYGGMQEGLFTRNVISTWWRPPELMLSNCKGVIYGPEVDMWSMGCILAELLIGAPLLQGRDDIDQLDKIFMVLGTPTPKTWPGVQRLPLWHMVPQGKYTAGRLKQWLHREARNRGNAPPHGAAVDLIEKLLCLDPAKRPSALDAFKHPWFWVHGPPPCQPIELPVHGSNHELMVHRKRQQEHEEAERPAWNKRARYNEAPARAPQATYPSAQVLRSSNLHASGIAVTGPLAPPVAHAPYPSSGYGGAGYAGCVTGPAHPPQVTGQGVAALRQMPHHSTHSMRPPAGHAPHGRSQGAHAANGWGQQSANRAMPPPDRQPQSARQTMRPPGSHYQATGSYQAADGHHGRGQQMMPTEHAPQGRAQPRPPTHTMGPLVNQASWGRDQHGAAGQAQAMPPPRGHALYGRPQSSQSVPGGQASYRQGQAASMMQPGSRQHAQSRTRP